MASTGPFKPASCLRPTPSTIRRAGYLIRAGELVIIPTDTVYGLAADATRDDAVKRAYSAKGRSYDKPMLALVASISMAEACATFCERAHALAQAFWPGPLTLVLHPSPSSPLSPLVNQSAVGVSLRFPANQISCALVAEVGSPLTASSANVSGALPPITAADAISGLGSSVALAIDGGKAKQAIESTILDLTGKTPKLLRTGSISPLSIKNVVGRLATDTRRFD